MIIPCHSFKSHFERKTSTISYDFAWRPVGLNLPTSIRDGVVTMNPLTAGHIFNQSVSHCDESCINKWSCKQHQRLYHWWIVSIESLQKSMAELPKCGYWPYPLVYWIGRTQILQPVFKISGHPGNEILSMIYVSKISMTIWQVGFGFKVSDTFNFCISQSQVVSLAIVASKLSAPSQVGCGSGERPRWIMLGYSWPGWPSWDRIGREDMIYIYI